MQPSRPLIPCLFSLALLASCDQASRNQTGEIVEAGNMDVFSLQLGDCFDDSVLDFVSDEISSLPGTPCTSPHDNEVYAVFDSTLSSYPGEDEMYEIAFNACRDRFDGFVGLDYYASELDIFTLYPTPTSWKQLEDREIVCAIYEMNGEKLTGSMAGSAR